MATARLGSCRVIGVPTTVCVATLTWAGIAAMLPGQIDPVSDLVDRCGAHDARSAGPQKGAASRYRLVSFPTMNPSVLLVVNLSSVPVASSDMCSSQPALIWLVATTVSLTHLWCSAGARPACTSGVNECRWSTGKHCRYAQRSSISPGC